MRPAVEVNAVSTIITRYLQAASTFICAAGRGPAGGLDIVKNALGWRLEESVLAFGKRPIWPCSWAALLSPTHLALLWFRPDPGHSVFGR